MKPHMINIFTLKSYGVDEKERKWLMQKAKNYIPVKKYDKMTTSDRGHIISARFFDAVGLVECLEKSLLTCKPHLAVRIKRAIKLLNKIISEK